MVKGKVAKVSGVKRTKGCDGVGSYRQPKWFSFDCEVETAQGRRLAFTRPGAWKRRFLILEGGRQIGGFEPTSAWSRKGVVQLDGELYELEQPSSWKSSLALVHRGQQVLLVRPKGFGIEFEATPDLDPALILFVCWMADGFRQQQAAAASA